MSKVHHMVLLKFSPAKAYRADELFVALGGLGKTIPGILDYSGGPYSSPEGMNQGYTHGFLFTFADESSRDVYLNHPDHENVKQAFLPDVEGVVAFDFVVS